MNQIQAQQETLEKKYKQIAGLNESMLNFTVPIRVQAVDYLNLEPGSKVLDIGCGTGASFRYFQEIVGPAGHIYGLDASQSMIDIAEKRIIEQRWENVSLQCGMAEEMALPEKYDGALLFAMHDVFNSRQAIINIKNSLKPNSRIVCVGPKKNKALPMALFNPMLSILFKRMAISQSNQFSPWVIAGEYFKQIELLSIKNGLLFIFVGERTE